MAFHLDDGLSEGRFSCAAEVLGYFCLLYKSRWTLIEVVMLMLMDGAVLVALSGEAWMSLIDAVINMRVTPMGATSARIGSAFCPIGQPVDSLHLLYATYAQPLAVIHMIRVVLNPVVDFLVSAAQV